MPSDDWEKEGKQEVLTLVYAVPEAIDHKDLKRILEVYDTHNPNFSTFEDDPDYQERVNGVSFRRFIKGIAKLESSYIERKDVRVDILARNVALVTGIDDWTSKKSSEITKGRSRFTIVFQKNETWKVIHEHFTRIK